MSNWDKNLFINHLRNQCSREVAKVGVSIIDFTEKHADDISWGRGTESDLILLFEKVFLLFGKLILLFGIHFLQSPEKCSCSPGKCYHHWGNCSYPSESVLAYIMCSYYPDCVLTI